MTAKDCKADSKRFGFDTPQPAEPCHDGTDKRMDFKVYLDDANYDNEDNPYGKLIFHQYTNMAVYRYTNISVFQFSGAAGHQHTGILIYWYTDILVYQHTVIPVYHYTGRLIYRYTSIWVYRYTGYRYSFFNTNTAYRLGKINTEEKIKSDLLEGVENNVPIEKSN